MPPPGPISGPRPIPFSYLDTDGALTANSDSKVASQKATKTYADDAKAGAIITSEAYTDSRFLTISRTIGNTTGQDPATSSTDGTFDLLLVDDLSNVFSNQLESIIETESILIIGSATATRRIRKSFNGVTIFDSGSLTISAGGKLSLRTMIVDLDASSNARSIVEATTSISTVPIITITDLTGVDFTNVLLDTSAAASGIGAASGDIISKSQLVRFISGL